MNGILNSMADIQDARLYGVNRTHSTCKVACGRTSFQGASNALYMTDDLCTIPYILSCKLNFVSKDSNLEKPEIRRCGRSSVKRACLAGCLDSISLISGYNLFTFEIKSVKEKSSVRVSARPPYTNRGLQ